MEREITAHIGALGEVTFAAGVYAYVGSAQTNLEKRVQRHLRKEKRKFWHIDYLLEDDAVKVVKVLYKQVNKAEECKGASEIGENAEAIVGFGCSDCHCKSHLFRLKNQKSVNKHFRIEGFSDNFSS